MPRLTASLSEPVYRQVCALAEESGLKPNDWLRALVLHQIVFQKGPDWEPFQPMPLTEQEEPAYGQPDPATLALLDSLLGLGGGT